MNPNLTVYSMADEIARGQLDAKAARGHLAAEAAAGHARRRTLRWRIGAALVRAGVLIHGSTKDIGATRPVTAQEVG